MAEYDPKHDAQVADAKDRSARTLAQGLLLDVAVAVVLVLSVAVTGLEWTQAYWTALGLSLARSVIQAGVSFFFRLIVPPKTDPTPTV